MILENFDLAVVTRHPRCVSRRLEYGACTMRIRLAKWSRVEQIFTESVV